MNKLLSATVVLLFAMAGYGQPLLPDQSYTLVAGNNIITAKNYYLLALLEVDKPARQLVEKDSVLAALLASKLNSITQALTGCKDSVACFTNNIAFSDNEINRVAERLAALYNPVNALGMLVKKHLVPSGNYMLLQQLPAKELLSKAWQQDARGINFAIDVYGGGKKPSYPLIDSIAFNTKAKGYPNLLHDIMYTVIKECSHDKLFFLPSLTAALRFLEINERINAADYEPMAKGENGAAISRMKSIRWTAYKYSLIMIPGAGPEEPGVALSAEGMLRCRLAALKFREGVAPFMVASGGKVHPYKTKYCEAVEMKKYLVETLHIPASAILIDPHARHTTTNMRNTVRLIYRYGMPMGKPALTCTTHGQSSMIENTLIARCIRELNVSPYKNGHRLSETEMEFYPLPEALQINPYEPMDP